MGNPDEWLETVRKCEYLPEQDIKKLCEMVSFEKLEEPLSLIFIDCELLQNSPLEVLRKSKIINPCTFFVTRSRSC